MFLLILYYNYLKNLEVLSVRIKSAIPSSFSSGNIFPGLSLHNFHQSVHGQHMIEGYFLTTSVRGIK